MQVVQKEQELQLQVQGVLLAETAETNLPLVLGSLATGDVHYPQAYVEELARQAAAYCTSHAPSSGRARRCRLCPQMDARAL